MILDGCLILAKQLQCLSHLSLIPLRQFPYTIVASHHADHEVSLDVKILYQEALETGSFLVYMSPSGAAIWCNVTMIVVLCCLPPGGELCQQMFYRIKLSSLTTLQEPHLGISMQQPLRLIEPPIKQHSRQSQENDHNGGEQHKHSRPLSCTPRLLTFLLDHEIVLLHFVFVLLLVPSITNFPVPRSLLLQLIQEHEFPLCGRCILVLFMRIANSVALVGNVGGRIVSGRAEGGA